jgi:hypothetical protein
MTVVERDLDVGPRISWGAVLAGALVALAIGAMLNLLGVALGASALDPYDMSRGDLKGLAAAGGLWLAISSAIGLFVGAWLAARAHGEWSIRAGGFHSLAVWAVAFAIALVIAGFTGAGFVGPLVRSAAVAPAVMASDAVDSSLLAPPDASGATAMAPSRSDEAVIDRARKATAGAAGWAFFSMLLGLLAALAGGWVAARGMGLRVHIHRPDAAAERVYTSGPGDPRV